MSYSYEPFFSFNDFNRLFDEVFGGRSPSDRRIESGKESENSVVRSFRPRMDVHESPESNLVTATVELPGLKKEDVSVDIRDNRLIISGEVNSSKEYEEGGYVHKERSTGKFSRTLPLPRNIQPSDIKASMENGVLTVTFPKTSPEEAPKKITIS